MGKPINEPAPAYVAVPVDMNSKKTDVERGNWNHSMEFLLSCVGFAVGLGNVWRFPYLCYSNGGGAFLIPYIIMLAIAGLPLFVLELGIGQFASKGCISIWAASPLFKGLGYAMCIITTLVCCYYNVIITYTVFYLFASFSKVLPWSSCGNYWNTPNCTVSMNSRTDFNNVSVSGYLADNKTEYFNGTLLPLAYQTRPSMEFWNNRVLERTDGIHDLGTIRWQLVLCLIFAWVVVYLCIMKGVKSSGKVVYFTATFPYVVLFILFIRGVTLPGAADGIIYYIKPNFRRLLDARVWKDAAVQIFFSLGPAFGCLPTLASYHKFNNNFHRDGIIISIINCGTSVFAGFVIFSVIGFMSYSSGLPVDKVAGSGPGLAFVAYPEAISRMPGAPFWAVLFFLMLFTLGLDSMFAYVETVITAICDELQPRYPDINKKKPLICLVVCLVLFLINLSMITQGGIYIVTLFDNYSAGMSVLVVAFLECVVISYVYGMERFCRDMSSMLGFKLNLYWKVCWMGICPLVLLSLAGKLSSNASSPSVLSMLFWLTEYSPSVKMAVSTGHTYNYGYLHWTLVGRSTLGYVMDAFIFTFFCVSYTPLTYEEYRYAPWAEAIGWLMVIAAIAMIPGYAIWYLATQTTGSPVQRLRNSITPNREWGPAHNADRVKAGYAIVNKQEMKDPAPGTPPPEYSSVCVDGENQLMDVGVTTAL